jgi:hypothetical protein
LGLLEGHPDNKACGARREARGTASVQLRLRRVCAPRKSEEGVAVHIFICTRLRRTIHYINSIKPRACFPRRAPRRGISAAEGRAEAHDKALNRAGVWRESAGQAGLGLSRARALLSRQTPARGAPPRPFPAARPSVAFPRRRVARHSPQQPNT